MLVLGPGRCCRVAFPSRPTRGPLCLAFLERAPNPLVRCRADRLPRARASRDKGGEARFGGSDRDSARTGGLLHPRPCPAPVRSEQILSGLGVHRAGSTAAGPGLDRRNRTAARPAVMHAGSPLAGGAVWLYETQVYPDKKSREQDRRRLRALLCECNDAVELGAQDLQPVTQPRSHALARSAGDRVAVCPNCGATQIKVPPT
jgi:hypothetical protein